MKRIYLVEWKDSWYSTHSDIVRARDKAHAWSKTKWRHPFSTYQIISITELY